MAKVLWLATWPRYILHCSAIFITCVTFYLILQQVYRIQKYTVRLESIVDFYYFISTGRDYSFAYLLFLVFGVVILFFVHITISLVSGLVVYLYLYLCVEAWFNKHNCFHYNRTVWNNWQITKGNVGYCQNIY